MNKWKRKWINDRIYECVHHFLTDWLTGWLTDFVTHLLWLPSRQLVKVFILLFSFVKINFVILMAELREIRNLHEPNPSKMKTFRYVFVMKISPWSFRGKMPPNDHLSSKQFFVLFPFRKTLKSFLILSPLLGLTWVFGLLAVTDAGLVFQYVFTILNSTQVCTNYVYACLFGQMGLGLSIRGLCPGKTILIPHFIYRFGSRSLLLRKQYVYFIGLKIKFIQGIIV